MLSSSLPAALCAALLITDAVSAVPSNAGSAADPDVHPGKRMVIPLNAPPTPQTDKEIREWRRRQALNLRRKYGAVGYEKRASSASVQLTDLNLDFTYSGAIQVGTPAQTFNVILDTGSSDLWLASSSCTTGCESVTAPFDSSKSTTFKNTNTPIDIKYGSGEVAGNIGNDTVTMAGFTVQNQALGVMDTVSPHVLQGSLSGLMGLGFRALTQTQADPWWVAAVNAGLWSQPLFGFYLARFVDKSGASNTETKGGSMDLGFTNTAYYTGEINYVSLTDESYWLIPLDGITINGKVLNPGGQAAIDTGTSLIGGPSSAMDSLYAQVPGAQPGSGSNAGYYVFPCSTKVTVSLKFGGKDYSIQTSDFSRPVDTSGTTCYGSFFPLDLSGSTVQWIVGDSFLKNVYSVYRSSPAAVGFAAVNAGGGGGGGGGGNGTTTTGTRGGSSPTSTRRGSNPTHSRGAAVRGAQILIIGSKSGSAAFGGLVVMGLAALFGTLVL